MKRFSLCLLALLVLLVLLVLLTPPIASADDEPIQDDNKRVEVRQAGTCTGTSRSRLRLRAEDASIRIEFEVDSRRVGSVWRVVLLHERQIVLRATRRTVRPGASFEVRRFVEDWYGADAIVARAIGPGGEICRASATVSADSSS